MSSSVVLPSEFKIENITFYSPKKNNQGGQSVLIAYYNEATGKTGPLLLQTPRCRTPFGADVSDGDKKTRKYSINLSLASSDSSNENLVKFTDILKQIDNKATSYARGDGAIQWFGKVHSEDMIGEMYKSGIKKSKNDKYPSTLKVKLPVKIVNDKLIPQFDIYDDKKSLQNVVSDDGTEIKLECIAKGGDYTGIIQCTGVWFVGNTSFGVGYKTIQARVSTPTKLIGYQIVDEEELVEEEEEEEIG